MDLSLPEQFLRVVFFNFLWGKKKENFISSFSILFQIRTPFNYLLMNLIIAESLITMYGLPVDFMATYHFGWKMGEHLCKATGFILTTSGKTGILLPELFWSTARKKKFKLSKYFFETRGWRTRIYKFFEITRTIYSNSERSEPFLVKECLFISFLDVSHI